ncbi:hypothetical protein SLS53_005917 [Cytospora paraplurivora]|uniref:Heterokaryon incompatibility domain-containing protein n=1 Tax=Cytospora paraplurivora TaxID=2898453 RepID=A0AAN9U3K9_9PEZI
MVRPVGLEVLFQTEQGGTRQVLRTTELKGLLDTLEQDLRDLEPDNARGRILSIGRCTNHAHGVLQGIAERVDRYRSDSVRLGFIREVSPSNIDQRLFERFYWTRYGRKILPHELEVAICALGHTLEYAVRSIWIRLGLGEAGNPDCPPMPRWYIPTSLRLRIKEQGFCRLDYERLKPTLGFLGVCMAATYDRRGEGKDHSHCTKQRCSGDDIKRETYQQRHVTEACRCPMTMPPQVHEKILASIGRDAIPIIKVAPASQGSGADLEFQVLEAGPEHEYIAISHVWANGRGNTEGNGLYRCQWLHLQSLALKCNKPTASALESRWDDLPAFWMDTACVPCGPGDPMITQLRHKAIVRMADVYRKATDVLVLDSQLENLSTESVEDLCMRVTLSSWMRRLWTMHEGAVGRSVLVQTAIGAVGLGGLSNRCLESVSQSGPDLPGGALRGMGFVEAVTMWSRCLNVDTGRGPGKDHFNFFFSWQESRRRSTSVALDRCLVMGLINDLKPEALFELQRTEEDMQDIEAAAPQKLKILLHNIPSIPPSIIFAPGSRLPGEGLGWAPGDLNSSISSPLRDEAAGVRTKEGLLVEYKGWELLSTPDRGRMFLRDVQYHHPVDEAGQRRAGRNTPLPPSLTSDTATILAETGKTMEDARWGFMVRVTGGHSSGSGVELYGVALIGFPEGETDTDGTTAPLAMILGQPMSSKSMHTVKEPARAILVEVKGEKDETVYAKFLSQARWSPLTKQQIEMVRFNVEEGLVEEVQARWFNHSSRQRWCVG